MSFLLSTLKTTLNVAAFLLEQPDNPEKENEYYQAVELEPVGDGQDLEQVFKVRTRK